MKKLAREVCLPPLGVDFLLAVEFFASEPRPDPSSALRSPDTSLLLLLLGAGALLLLLLLLLGADALLAKLL